MPAPYLASFHRACVGVAATQRKPACRPNSKRCPGRRAWGPDQRCIQWRLAIAHHLLDRHRGDARECRLGDRALQQALAACSTASTASTESTAEQLSEDARLLLVHLTGDLGQVGRVLESVHAALVRKWEVLLLRLLLQVLG